MNCCKCLHVALNQLWMYVIQPLENLFPRNLTENTISFMKNVRLIMSFEQCLQFELNWIILLLSSYFCTDIILSNWYLYAKVVALITETSKDFSWDIDIKRSFVMYIWDLSPKTLTDDIFACFMYDACDMFLIDWTLSRYFKICYSHIVIAVKRNYSEHVVPISWRFLWTHVAWFNKKYTTEYPADVISNPRSVISLENVYF